MRGAVTLEGEEVDDMVAAAGGSLSPRSITTLTPFHSRTGALVTWLTDGRQYMPFEDRSFTLRAFRFISEIDARRARSTRVRLGTRARPLSTFYGTEGEGAAEGDEDREITL